MPFVARFAAFRSQKWVDVRDRVHVEAPDGWIATEGPKAEPISVTDVTSAEPVRDNLPAFARAVRGRASYPIAGAQMGAAR